MDDKDSSSNSPANSLFKLRWDAQRSALLGSVATLFHEEAFVDTTICTDGKIFKAHRLLLSASSPYLKHVLQSAPGDHAILLLPHINAKDFQHVLQFIYEGEIKISQKDLKSFLQVSKLLRIKGMDFDDEEAEEFFSSESNTKTTRDSFSPPNVTSSAEYNKKVGNLHHAQSPSPNSAPANMPALNDIVVSTNNNNNNNTNNNNNNEVRKMAHRDMEQHSGSASPPAKYRRLDTNTSHSEDEEDYQDEMLNDGADGIDDGMYQSLLPEVSMEESEESDGNYGNGKMDRGWGMPSSSSGAGMRMGYNNNGFGGMKKDGILLRMMKEPLKSGGGGGGHGQVAAAMNYELDEAGLKRTKRYVQCTSCSKVLSSLSALKRHMEDVHCARIQGKCLICGRVYSSRNSLLTHVYSAHKKHHDYKAVARIIRESDFETFASTN